MSVVDEERDAVQRELAEAIGSDEEDRLALAFGGLLEMLAQAVVFPIMASFGSAALLEKWKQARSRDERAAVGEELAAAPLQPEPVVDGEALVAEVVAHLVAEGVKPEVASRVVAGAFRRVRERAAAG